MDFDLEKFEDEPEKAVKSEPVNDGFDIFSDVENSDDEKDKRKKKKDRKRSRSRDRKDRKRSRSRDRRRSRSRDRKGNYMYYRYEIFSHNFPIFSILITISQINVDESDLTMLMSKLRNQKQVISPNISMKLKRTKKSRLMSRSKVN